MVSIVDYGAGNLVSVKRALSFAGIDSVITADPSVIALAARIIFPGVGNAASAMAVINDRGIGSALHEAYNKGTPILGICLGTQIIFDSSEEGDTKCVGLIAGNCPKLSLSDSSLKIPHMGWNSITLLRSHPVLDGITDGTEFYFVHSYYPNPICKDDIVCTCEYEINFPAVIGRNNLIATQFHPEKSGKAGLRILSNFSKWNGQC